MDTIDIYDLKQSDVVTEDERSPYDRYIFTDNGDRSDIRKMIEAEGANVVDEYPKLFVWSKRMNIFVPFAPYSY